MTPTKAELCREAVGFVPHKVLVFENPLKNGVLYLRWRAGGNWKWKSLGIGLRDDKGRVLAHVKTMARDEAMKQYEILSGRRAATAAEKARPLTIGDTWAVISDEKTGPYPVDTPHRREVGRALRAAVRIWGADLPWEVIDRARIRTLARTRIDEIRATGAIGYRGAEVTVARILSVAGWLRDENLISVTAAVVPKSWKAELKKYWRETTGSASDPAPARPRHTVDQLRGILAKASKVDPRFDLLLELGAELRLGQVVRCRRSDLNLDAGTLTVRSSGKKRGTIVWLTARQLAAVRAALADGGYLARLEAELPDYQLFPAGQLPGGRSGKGVADPKRHGGEATIDRTAIREWFHEAEDLAEVPRLKGRAGYGLRRVSVDEAKRHGISREGLKSLGGWTDTQMPDRVYAEQDAEHAGNEARDSRAKIRGESE